MIKRILTTAVAGVTLAAGTFLGLGTAAAPAHATTCPSGTWNAETLGKPAAVAPGMDGVALYRNYNDGVFSLRMSTPRRVDAYWGSITTDGTLRYRKARTERGDYVRQVAPNKVVFRMLNFGAIDGLDFGAVCGSHITVHLGVWHHELPTAHILLGSAGTHPTTNPFTETKA